MAVNLISQSPPVVRFGLEHQDGIRGVSVLQELHRPRLGPKLDRTNDIWRADLDVSGVDRLEYLFQVTDAEGHPALVLDPDNPRRAPGHLGEKSDFRLPGYQPPLWLDHPGEGRVRTVEVGAGANVPEVGVWSPPRVRRTTALPMLLVHDGAEYARYSRLLEFCWWAIAEGEVGAFRVALLDPGERNREYSAAPDYTSHLEESVIPALTERFRSTSMLGMGASLGALAMMHFHVHGRVLDGLFLQSGAFFRPGLDAVESQLTGFGRISNFVGELLKGDLVPRPTPVSMTCGTVEENLANNRLLCEHLAKNGWDVGLLEHRDAHNWVAWRDSLHTGLLPLLRRVWG
ncbi:MAG: esterase [Acidimicrobiia bacterium]|nr:esterase [Acidimicrobiia bacterium]